MAQVDSQVAASRPDYPYGSQPLLPQWWDSSAQLLAALVVVCAGASIVLHWTVWPIDRLALLVGLPALIGITLAFAPDPPAFVSRLAKRLTTIGCAIGTLMGPSLAPAILCVPIVLALSVGIGALLHTKPD